MVAGRDCVINIAGSGYLRTQEVEKFICVIVDASSQLDLLYHLVGCMVELLFCADDAENIQDESQQDDRDEDEQKRAQIIGVAGLGM